MSMSNISDYIEQFVLDKLNVLMKEEMRIKAYITFFYQTKRLPIIRFGSITRRRNITRMYSFPLWMST